MLLKRFMATVSVETSLKGVLRRVKEAADRYAKDNGRNAVCMPRLVAVSKTKPVEVIEDAYKCGQRNFGENYVQELVQKASYFKDKSGFDDIRWHFIGRLQRNKSNNLCGAPNLFMVETVDSLKLADALNKSWSRTGKSEKLKIMVQVNTSDEKAKGGCEPDQCCSLVEHVITKCDNLEFAGLMTIGMLGASSSRDINPDFEIVRLKFIITSEECLVNCRKDVCKRLELDENDVELSMGMSSDFEQAILAGSTNVRVGSTIFGQREAKEKQTAPENIVTNSHTPSVSTSKEQDTTLCNSTDIGKLSLEDVHAVN